MVILGLGGQNFLPRVAAVQVCSDVFSQKYYPPSHPDVWWQVEAKVCGTDVAGCFTPTTHLVQWLASNGDFDPRNYVWIFKGSVGGVQAYYDSQSGTSLFESANRTYNFVADYAYSFLNMTAYDRIARRFTPYLWATATISDSPCTGGSVAHGTLITRPDGSQVPVQNLKPGDRIIMYDVYSRTSLVATITQIRQTSVDNQLSIRVGHEQSLRVDANPRLKFYVWTVDGPVLKPVTTLRLGDLLYSYDASRWVPVTGAAITYGGTHVYYDLMTSPYLNANGQLLSFIANGYADPCTTPCKQGPSP